MSYHGVSLTGLWEDERLTSLEDVPVLRGSEPHVDRAGSYRVVDHWLLDCEAGLWYAAPGLEVWLLALLREPLRHAIELRMSPKQRKRLLP